MTLFINLFLILWRGSFKFFEVWHYSCQSITFAIYFWKRAISCSYQGYSPWKFINGLSIGLSKTKLPPSVRKRASLQSPFSNLSAGIKKHKTVHGHSLSKSVALSLSLFKIELLPLSFSIRLKACVIPTTR